MDYITNGITKMDYNQTQIYKVKQFQPLFSVRSKNLGEKYESYKINIISFVLKMLNDRLIKEYTMS